MVKYGRRCLVSIIVLTILACQSAPVKRVETVAADVLLPPAQEEQLGKQLAQEIEQQVPILESPFVTTYVSAVGSRVVAASPNSDIFPISFKIINDERTVNAFAIPGGDIYVYTGLLKSAADEAELAGVLAHEVAHVTSRHIAKRMVNAFGLQTLARLALGNDPTLLEQIAASITIEGALLKNSREDESEADAKGVVAASRAGYDPRGFIQFFKKLQEAGERPGLSFLSSHPPPEDRIEAIEEIINEENLTGDQRKQRAFQAMQKQLPSSNQ